MNYIKDVKSALLSSLSPFFIGGNTVQINGGDVIFYDCEIKFGIERLKDAFTGKPLIVIFTPTEYGRDTLKCDGGFRHELMLRSRVVVKVGNRQLLEDTAGELIGPTELGHEVWSQLFLVATTQEDRFVSYGLRHVELESSPNEMHSETQQESLLYGNLSYEYAVTLKHDAFVAP